MKRGPRPRAGERSTERIEIRLTLGELRDLRAFAARDGSTLADVLRLAALDMAADAGDASPLDLGRRLLDRICVRSQFPRDGRTDLSRSRLAGAASIDAAR